MTGAELREARLLLGLSQAELARVMGMPQPSLARLETGERRITNIHAAFVRHLLECRGAADNDNGGR